MAVAVGGEGHRALALRLELDDLDAAPVAGGDRAGFGEPPWFRRDARADAPADEGHRVAGLSVLIDEAYATAGPGEQAADFSRDLGGGRGPVDPRGVAAQLGRDRRGGVVLLRLDGLACRELVQD